MHLVMHLANGLLPRPVTAGFAVSTQLARLNWIDVLVIAIYFAIVAAHQLTPYMALLGRVMPLQISGDPENPLVSHHVVQVQFVTADRGTPTI